MKIVRYSIIVKIKICMAFILLAMSCEKFVEVEPPVTFVTSESAFSTNQTAIAEMNGIYGDISSEIISDFGGSVISTITGLGSDELKMIVSGFEPDTYSFYKNELTKEIYTPGRIWGHGYSHLFHINTILEGLVNVQTTDQNPQSKLSPAVKKQLLGEARFMRAFIYFYLVNCFGDVPLITTTDYKVNNNMSRTNKDLVYQQMVVDLLEAEKLLNVNYINPDLVTVSSSSDRTRPTKWAAAALLARIYLYMGKYIEAETQANSVINNTALYSLVAPKEVFLKNSKETIFAFQPTQIGYHSNYGRVFLLPPTGPVSSGPSPYYLNEDLVGSFEFGDPRLLNWISSVTVGSEIYYYPIKYQHGLNYDASIDQTTKTQNMLEYNMVLRLGEQYLIRAEARARNNDLDGAIADINTIRTRARNGAATTVLPNLTGTLNFAQVLDAVSKERRHELFTEWGDRWFDLKRTGRLDAVMEIITPMKSNKNWNINQALYPIERGLLTTNPNLTQNRGY